MFHSSGHRALRAGSLVIAAFAVVLAGGCSAPQIIAPVVAPAVVPSVVEPERSRRDALDAHYARWRGTPYRFGGASTRGVDCSAFVQITYTHLFGHRLPRVTRSQRRAGRDVTGAPPRIGDLVFFDTVGKDSHVGIYAGEGTFIHASTTRGVVRDRLDRAYWSSRHSGTVRILREAG